MALSCFSKFYYGLEINEDNQNLDFEDSSVKVAVLNVGVYTHDEIATEVERAFNLAGSQLYSVTLDRATRQLSISAAGNFKLKTESGLYIDTTGYNLLGFNMEADYSGSNSYQGESGAGFEYSPQYPLQSYVPPEINQGARNGVVNESTSGEIEAITFGTKKTMECEIFFITNIPQPTNTWIRNNGGGYEDAQRFLEAAVRKVPMEFILDETKPGEYQKFILASTEEDQNGLGFKLYEEWDKGWPDYFRTGTLTWTLQE